MRATLAWFTPIRPGHVAYRSVKLKIARLENNALAIAGVKTTTGQPSNSQSESGTIIHRRWRGEFIGSHAEGASIQIQVQRERDQGTPIDEAIPFGLAVTVEMPGAVQVYEQTLNKIKLKPQVRINP